MARGFEVTKQPKALRLADALETLSPLERDAAAELRRLHQHELSNEVWHTKTEWVQETMQPRELGMHRADALRERIEKLHAQRQARL